MKTNEAVEVFAHRLESLLRQALPDLDGAARDAVLKQRFIRGMEAPIRLRLYENPALTYAQCVTTARQLQSAVKQLSDEGVTLPSTTSSSAGQRLQGGASAAVTIKAEPEGHANSMRFASARTADTSRNNQRQQQSTPLTCFNCGKVGHKSAQCWASRGQPSRQTGRNDNSQRDFVRNEQQQVEKPQLTCFECDGRGHKQDICPSRNDASAAPKQRQQPSKPSYQARPNSGMSTRNTITGTEHFEYIADAQADGRHVSCLLDSGAADNFMSFELFDRLFPSREYASTIEDESVRAANGTTMRIRGRVSIEMDFGTYSTSLKMTLLEDLCYDVVLGIGFFDTHVESVWPGKLNMQMNDGSTVRFRRSGIKKTQVTALVCSESVTILPQSKSSLQCNITQAISTSSLLCIADTAPLLERYGVIIPYGVFDSSKSVTHRIQVINPTGEPVTLHQDARIALLEECEVVRGARNSEPGLNAVAKGLRTPKISLEDVGCDATYQTGNERHRLETLLIEYADVFSIDGQRPGRTSAVDHHIDMQPDARPFKLPSRRVPLHLKGEVDKEIDAMLDWDVIEPSASEYSSPPVLVRKKDGRIRFCVDYRKLNQLTLKDNYPLPRIDDALDSIGEGCRYFTKLDLAMGYHHVPIAPEDRAKTAFSTRRGLFQFKVMPFGLTNAPATFQRLMEKVLCRMNWRECLVYIDDVLVWARTFDEHIDKLTRIFKTFRDAGLRLKTSKCQICRHDVHYLGHVLGVDGLRMDPERVRAVQDI